MSPIPAPVQAKLEQVQASVTIFLQDPALLRMIVMALIGVIGLGVPGIPMYYKIAALQASLSQERSRHDLIKEHEYIVSHLKKYKKRLIKEGDMDWWVEAIAETTRECHLKVIEFKPTHAKGSGGKIGTYEGIIFTISLTGAYPDIVRFIGVLENQQEVVRIYNIGMKKQKLDIAIEATFTLALLATKSKGAPQAENTAGGESRRRKKGAPPPAEPEDGAATEPASTEPKAKPAAPAPKAKETKSAAGEKAGAPKR